MTLDDVTDAAVDRIRASAAPTPPVSDVLEQAADRLRDAVGEMAEVNRHHTPIYRVMRLFAAGAAAVEWAAREHRMTGVCSGCGPHGCSARVSASALCDWAIALLRPDEAPTPDAEVMVTIELPDDAPAWIFQQAAQGEPLRGTESAGTGPAGGLPPTAPGSPGSVDAGGAR